MPPHGTWNKADRGTNEGRGPQWRCKPCGGLPNDENRAKCRWCSSLRPMPKPEGRAHQQAGAKREPPAFVQPRTWPVRPPPPEEQEEQTAAKAAALEAAASSLRAAGLEKETSRLNEANSRMQKEGKPSSGPGARLDGCARYVARAEHRAQAAAAEVHAAEEALAAARARQEELDAELAEGQARLDSLRAGLAASEASQEEAGDGAVGELLRRTKVFIQRLETGKFANTAEMPAEVINAMTAVNEVVGAMTTPLSRPDLDSELEPPDVTEASGAMRRKAQAMGSEEDQEQEQPGQDDAMRELDGIDEEDEPRTSEGVKKHVYKVRAEI